MLIAALFTIAKGWKPPKHPLVNEWIKKLWYIYTMEYCSRHKEGSPTLCKSLEEVETIMLSEISQRVRDKYHVISPISGT